MEAFIFIFIVAGIIFYFYTRSSTPKQTSRNKPKAQNTKQPDTKEWLLKRWELAEEHRKQGDQSIFRNWFFDPITDRQKNRLQEEGYKVPKELTKGQASDLIGLNEPPDEGQLKILKFFKIPTKGLSQTKAGHEVGMLFQDPEKVEAWENRPPTQIQREEAKFFGVKLPKGSTAPQADKLIRNHQSELKEDDPKFEEWEAVEDVMDQFSDTEMLKEDYDIKKPSFTLIMAALRKLKEEGQSYQDSADDIDLVIDKLLELKPELERS